MTVDDFVVLSFVTDPLPPDWPDMVKQLMLDRFTVKLDGQKRWVRGVVGWIASLSNWTARKGGYGVWWDGLLHCQTGRPEKVGTGCGGMDRFTVKLDGQKRWVRGVVGWIASLSNWTARKGGYGVWWDGSLHCQTGRPEKVGTGCGGMDRKGGYGVWWDATTNNNKEDF